VKHTYLFEPAVWSVAGTFWRADGEALEAVGRTQIAHRQECWLLSGTLKVLSSPPVEFVHAYWIEPPGPQGGSVRWTFDVEILARLIGESDRGTAAVARCLYELPLDEWRDVPGSKLTRAAYVRAAPAKAG